MARPSETQLVENGLGGGDIAAVKIDEQTGVLIGGYADKEDQHSHHTKRALASLVVGGVLAIAGALLVRRRPAAPRAADKSGPQSSS